MPPTSPLPWRQRVTIALILILSGCCPTPQSASSARPVTAGSPSAAVSSAAPRATATTSHKEDIAPEAATGFQPRDPVTGGHSMVAAANPHAARAGQQMLREGGSAVDAAIAMALVLTLVEPQSSGIGGGAFLLHYQSDSRTVQAYDGRETAPALADEKMFLDAQGKRRPFMDAVVGGLSVGVPGQLRMLEMAHKAHGKLPWKRLFVPAIELAKKGFAVSPRLHKLLLFARRLRSMPAAAAYFLGPQGRPKPVGSTLQNAPLAAVLERIANHGADAFYTGDLARDIANAASSAKRNPGRMRKTDLSSYRAVKRTALCRPYRKYEVCGMPPPTSGGVTTLQILGMLERFTLAPENAFSSETVHLVTEASRLAFADRSVYLADSDFVKVPVAALLAPPYLASRAALIDPNKSMGRALPGVLPTTQSQGWGQDQSHEVPATSHLVVVDNHGNAVSMTASIESAFGSHLLVHGFLLNNELTDFSFVPNHDGKPVANRVQAGKRPRSSMAPIIVLDRRDRRFVMALGSPGGSRIIGYVTQVLVDVLDHRLQLQDALERPHYVNRNGTTDLEDWPAKRAWVAATKKALEKRGHRVNVRSLNSGLHAIMRGDGGWIGAADPRREGLVLAD